MGSFVWSPDSTKIAYIAEIKDTSKEKCLYNAKLDKEKEDCLNENNYEKVNRKFKYNKYKIAEIIHIIF